MFVTIQASLLVRKANEISALLEMNVGGSKLLFSEAPSFLTSRSHVTRAFMVDLFNLPVYSRCSCVPMYMTTPSERRGFALAVLFIYTCV